MPPICGVTKIFNLLTFFIIGLLFILENSDSTTSVPYPESNLFFNPQIISFSFTISPLEVLIIIGFFFANFKIFYSTCILFGY